MFILVIFVIFISTELILAHLKDFKCSISDIRYENIMKCTPYLKAEAC